METIIKVSIQISTELHSREEANTLFSSIKKKTNVFIIDFADVTFISRSFADEFYNLYQQHLKQQYQIRYKNAITEITQMLDAVSRTQTKRDNIVYSSNTRSFSNVSLLSEYLLSI